MAYNRDEGNRYVIPIGTGAGTVFRTKNGSGGKCSKPKGEKDTNFISADDYRYASHVDFLDSLMLEKQAFHSGGTVFTLFCDPNAETEE